MPGAAVDTAFFYHRNQVRALLQSSGTLPKASGISRIDGSKVCTATTGAYGMRGMRLERPSRSHAPMRAAPRKKRTGWMAGSQDRPGHWACRMADQRVVHRFDVRRSRGCPVSNGPAHQDGMEPAAQDLGRRSRMCRRPVAVTRAARCRTDPAVPRDGMSVALPRHAGGSKGPQSAWTAA